MIFSTEIYTENSLYGQGIDVTESFVELYDDFIISIYRNKSKLSLKPYYWYFYYFNNDWIEIDNKLITTGQIQINLNDYGIQNQNNKFKIIIKDKRANQILIDTIIKYGFNSYIETEYPFYENLLYDKPQGSTYVEPLRIQHKFPNVNVKKIDKKEKLNIIINSIKEDKKW